MSEKRWGIILSGNQVIMTMFLHGFRPKGFASPAFTGFA
jgi:hypothetical protein